MPPLNITSLRKIEKLHKIDSRPYCLMCRFDGYPWNQIEMKVIKLLNIFKGSNAFVSETPFLPVLIIVVFDPQSPEFNAYNKIKSS